MTHGGIHFLVLHVVATQNAFYVVQGSEGPHLVANAAFLAEKTAKEGAEAKLATLRRSTAHKDDLLKALKAKASPVHEQNKRTR